MKKSKFLEIAREYQESRRRFRRINIGDLVWETGGYGDMFCAIVKAVNIDECYVDVIDVSSHNAEKRYKGFVTEEEMLKEGFSKQNIEKERKMYEGIIKRVLEQGN